MLEAASAVDSWRRPEGSWALGDENEYSIYLCRFVSFRWFRRFVVSGFSTSPFNQVTNCLESEANTLSR